jgi:Arc/MetJ-type ribon-helix-helix transcriptional regulator
MKVSVSLPEEDLAYIDEYASRVGYSSRSSVLQHAISLLRMSEMGDAYAAAWTEWNRSGSGGRWEPTSGDGLANATR